MRVYADFSQEVKIDPKDVLQKLLDSELGNYQNWDTERDGKYYIGYEQSAGCHSIDQYYEITKEQYDIIQNLKTLIEYYKSKK